jgi:hypothetical protein
VATHESVTGLFQAAAANTLGKTDLQILRVADDQFRQAAITAGSAVFKESEILTRQTISQKLLDDFAKQGVTAITYSDGRKVPVTSYADMVGRTMSGNAAIQANINHYSQHGFDLLLISAHFGTCALCEPWQGRVVSQSGQNTKYPSLQDAINAKLFHPNCFVDKQVPIMTSKGWKQIGEIVVGDLVLSHNGKYRKVTKLHHNQGSPKIVRIEVNNGDRKRENRLTITEEHPLLVNGEWTPAKDVKVGDKVNMLCRPCENCGQPSPLYRQTCSDKCANKIVIKKRDKPEYWAKLGKIASKRMKRLYSEGLLDRVAITRAAHNKTREMVIDGTHPFQKPINHIKAQQSLGRKNYGKTWLEEKVGWYLKEKLKLDIACQHPVPKDRDKKGRQRYYFVDFAIRGKKVAIECDGSYWHKDKAKDEARQAHIESQGYTVLRFTDNQINGDLKACGDEVIRVLANHDDDYIFSDVKVTKVEIQEPKRVYPLYNISVEVDESYIAKGFVVHNCIHGVAPWREGQPIPEMRVDPEHQKLIDEHGKEKAGEIVYKAQQRQRELERGIRQWKLREATAIDPAAKLKAQAKVKQWQSSQRLHIAESPFLRRDYAREGLKGITGNTPPTTVKGKFVPAKTIEEARKYALQYVDIIDLEGVGLRQLNEINRGLDATRANYDFKTGKLAYLPRKHANHAAAAHQAQMFTGESKALYYKKTMLKNPDKAHTRELTAWTQVRPSNLNRLKTQIEDPAYVNIKSFLEEKLRRAEVTSRWSMSQSAKEGDYLFSITAHENGHAIMSKYQLDAKWKASLTANQVDILDLYRVSEYAATNNSELFAEVTSAIAQGRSSEIPRNILAAYRDTIGSIGGI